MIRIEPFHPRYIEDLYSISLATGHMGGDASHLYEDARLMGLIYSVPYAVLAASLVLLALDEIGVVGFVLGAVDTQEWEDRLETEWWPRLRREYHDPSHIPPSQWTADQRRLHMIHHPTRVAVEIATPYPAHLHLNLLPRAQGAGAGSRLIEAWLELARPYSPTGVHVGVNRQNAGAIVFWSRKGFRELAPASTLPGRTVWMGRTFR